MRYTTDRDSELYHYGVKGMKWGVHRSRTDTGHTSSKKSSGVKTKKRKGLSKGQKEFLKSLGIGVATVGITGAALYGMDKAQQKAVDSAWEYANKKAREQQARQQKTNSEYRRKQENWSKQAGEQRKQWRDAESRHRAQQDQYRSRQNQNRSNQDQYRPHQNTAQTKSQDRAKKYQGQNIDYESARKRAANLRDKVAKAQRDGTLTPQMVNDLQEAMAQVKAARSQMQHGIWYINNRDRVLMHSGMRGVVCRVRRTK